MAMGDIRSTTETTAVIGDDIRSDVGGAKKNGLGGILVKTGKYRPEVLGRAEVQPDLILDSISQLPEKRLPEMTFS